MTIVKDILTQMPGLAKPQVKFMTALFASILALRGHVNFRNLSRYSNYCERTIARQFRRPFDWPTLNQRLTRQVLPSTNQVMAAQDASFIPKSGKRTYGLDRFFNSCAGRVERGLEISTLALVDVTRNCAYTLAVAQTPPTDTSAAQEREQTRVDFYLQQLSAHRPLLPAAVKYLAADGFFAKKKYVDGVRKCDLHLITKLRCDADLRYLYSGPRRTGPGRPRRYDGKVDFQDLSRFDYLGTLAEAEHLHLYGAVVYHVRLKQRLRVAVVVNRKNAAKPRHVVLASTDTELDERELVRLYGARFQIEFLFRDGKQFTGLSDCQARDQKALDFHVNAALTTLNLARIEEVKAQAEVAPFIFSMASRKQCAFNELYLEMISERLALDLSEIKNHPAYEEIRTYGAIAA
jgi:DDE superfamily endonuclease